MSLETITCWTSGCKALPGILGFCGGSYIKAKGCIWKDIIDPIGFYPLQSMELIQENIW